MKPETQMLTDVHAHILPGLDDGARDMAETCCLLKSAYAQGVRHVIATPHYGMGDAVDGEGREVSAVLASVDKVRNEVLNIAADLRIYPGQEIFYFYGLEDLLDAGKALTMAGTRYVLIEFPPGIRLRKMELSVRRLVLRGYTPVIAHVERYEALRTKGAAETLTRAGAWLQMNFSSLLQEPAILRNPFKWGGVPEVLWCRRMVREGMIHLLGTDMHRSDYRPPLLKEAVQWMERELGDEDYSRLLWRNPKKLLEDMEESRKSSRQSKR